MAYSAETVAWATGFHTCWRCGRRGVWPQTLSIHHFVRGSSRHANDLNTMAISCSFCHDDEHRGISDGLTIWLARKMIHDPENYDRVHVNLARGRAADAISEQDVARAVTALLVETFP